MANMDLNFAFACVEDIDKIYVSYLSTLVP